MWGAPGHLSFQIEEAKYNGTFLPEKKPPEAGEDFPQSLGLSLTSKHLLAALPGDIAVGVPVPAVRLTRFWGPQPRPS